MKTPTKRILLISLGLLYFVTNPALLASAQEPCAGCGCSENCRTVCRLDREDKKVTTTCWRSQAEEFCIPGPSQPGCKYEIQVCQESPDAVCQPPLIPPKQLVWTDWLPDCAKSHTRHKLMKKTITTTIPSYRWVTETLCEHCEAMRAEQDFPSAD